MIGEAKIDPLGDDVALVGYAGRLNMASAHRLTKAVEEAIEEGRTRIVIDLAETSFIDSSGLGALIAALKRTREAGGDLRVARATDQAVAVLCLTNLDRILRPYLSLTSALDGWRA